MTELFYKNWPKYGYHRLGLELSFIHKVFYCYQFILLHMRYRKIKVKITYIIARRHIYFSFCVLYFILPVCGPTSFAEATRTTQMVGRPLPHNGDAVFNCGVYPLKLLYFQQESK